MGCPHSDRLRGRPSPIMTPHLRIARPVRDLARAVAMYRDGLGLRVVGRFDDHDGFDGVMLAPAGAGYHLEFTRCRAHPIAPAPTAEDLLVLYVPDADTWEATTARMRTAGFVQVESYNPYWDRLGRTFQDAEGYRVVLQNDAWHGSDAA
jgi:catechol 2,3-dioxygenase-like lactoylglutathione lyase family enzyme